MEIFQTPSRMQAWSLQQKRKGAAIGFVPTMGYLHEGHLRLVDLAKRHSDKTIVSIYVNPTQFGPNEDFDAYPRDLVRDQKLLADRGCDILFTPHDSDMYPEGHLTFVTVERLTEGLCGRSRPGHFRGVTTVVAKLLLVVQPDVAVFGQKDAQQLAVIRRMVRDLGMPVQILAGDIVREPGGLAMSSRNKYLSDQERREGPVLYQSLLKAKALYEQGERDASPIKAAVTKAIQATRSAKIDYVSVVDQTELTPLQRIDKDGALVAVAVFFGKTRLIDNIILNSEE